MDDCMLDFRLTDDGELEMINLQEATEDFIFEKCYPKLAAMLASDELGLDLSGEMSEAQKQLVRSAVEFERSRLWGEKEPKGPKATTELGRRYEKELGMAGPVADDFAKETFKRVLKSKAGERGKPN